MLNFLAGLCTWGAGVWGRLWSNGRIGLGQSSDRERVWGSLNAEGWIYVPIPEKHWPSHVECFNYIRDSHPFDSPVTVRCCRYPRLFLENRIYCSRVFRKLHIEVRRMGEDSGLA